MLRFATMPSHVGWTTVTVAALFIAMAFLPCAIGWPQAFRLAYVRALCHTKNVACRTRPVRQLGFSQTSFGPTASAFRCCGGGPGRRGTKVWCALW